MACVSDRLGEFVVVTLVMRAWEGCLRTMGDVASFQRFCQTLILLDSEMAERVLRRPNVLVKRKYQNDWKSREKRTGALKKLNPPTENC